MRLALFILILSFSLSGFAKSDCQILLQAYEKFHSLRVIDVKKEFRLNSGRFIPSGTYRLRYNESLVTDLDGLVEKDKSFPGISEMMARLEYGLGQANHPFYKHVRFRYNLNSGRSQDPKFLFLEDQKRKLQWDSLGFVPSDESSIVNHSKQTQALFRRLRNLRHKYSLEFIPEALHVSHPQELLEFYTTAYDQAIADVESLKIKNVTSPTEEKANELLEHLIHELTFVERKNVRAFEAHFINSPTAQKWIDVASLNPKDYNVLNILRSQIRAAITEFYVAMKLPQTVAVGTTLRKAFAAGHFETHPEAENELQESGLWNREIDVLTKNGIFEVKSALTPDFRCTRSLQSPSLTMTKPEASLESENAFDRCERIQEQENARDQMVSILKKHSLVQKDFTGAVIYADGKILTDRELDGRSIGLINLGL